MSDENTLISGMVERIELFKKADIAVGIASYNNAETIGHVVETARTALRRDLSKYQGIIIHADGGSTDDTVLKASNGDANGVPILPISYPILPGKKLAESKLEIPERSKALKAILRAAEQLQTKVCVVLAPNLLGISPASVSALVRPVLDAGFDFVAPYYSRHKFEGLVTSGIVYPFMRALYGKRIRQPMGGDFAVSQNLSQHYLSQTVWNTETGRQGIDLWMVTEAISRGFKLCQARVGAMSRAADTSPTDLSVALAQVLTVLFDLAIHAVTIWQHPRGSETVPLMGISPEVPLAPVTLDTVRLVESFRLGYQNLQPLWSAILPPATILILKRMASVSHERFLLPDKTWVRTVYDFVLGYRLRIMNRDHLLRAFTPLYLAWVASFATEMQDASPEEVERRFEALCIVFETEKPYLISRWRWPDRFNP